MMRSTEIYEAYLGLASDTKAEIVKILSQQEGKKIILDKSDIVRVYVYDCCDEVFGVYVNQIAYEDEQLKVFTIYNEIIKTKDIVPASWFDILEQIEYSLEIKKIKKSMKRKTYKTNYDVAVHWCGNHYILCNSIGEIDQSVYGNMRFNVFDEEENPIEIYQWFLSDCSESDVAYLEEQFGLQFTYSEMLGLYILCVTHCGTSWDYVYWTTFNKYAERDLGEGK